ncbi:MAG: helix-turn-helix transcriptional regulator [Clostridia bacterium]|nr:LuxR C-terminal-related transcriptional regulator [Lachnospiraceae bacterium]NCB99712.1 helix-turn-helix transcriptional regulator [Clostridia bacterium]NCD01715.1 helix-turn-helix transcriptional regulator [Clostridia bacterium]
MDEKYILEALECENPFIGGMYLWETAEQVKTGFEELEGKIKGKSCQIGLALFKGYAAFYRGDIIEAQETAWQIFQDRKLVKDDETAYMQCLGAAYLLELMARHGLDKRMWKEATIYIADLAENSSAGKRCREAAQLYRAMSCMALAMMAEVPMWIRNREFGVCCIHQKPYYGENSIHPQNLATAMFTSAQYLSYVGEPLLSLNAIAEAQQFYHIDNNRLFFIYLEILKAGNYGQLHLMAEMDESLRLAVKLLAEEKLWLVLAEFIDEFGREYVNEILAEYSEEGVREVSRIADGFRERVSTLHKILASENKPLTEQERKILYRMAEGYSDKEIAEEIHIVKGTVKYHVRKAYAKLGIDKNVKIKDAIAVRDVQAVWMK